MHEFDIGLPSEKEYITKANVGEVNNEQVNPIKLISIYLGCTRMFINFIHNIRFSVVVTHYNEGFA